MRTSFLHAASANGLVGWMILSGAITPICQGCTSRPPQSATAPSAPVPIGEPWRLEIHLSGGFAGLDRQLELSSTGELTASDRRRDTHITARLSAGEIAQIDALIPVAPAVSASRTGCADCLLYDLTLYVHGQSVVVHLDDISLGRSGTEPLIRSLLTLLDSALTGRLNPAGN
jgi:hypothetical protein